jgi:hydroxymethylglutaryl-CoA lyase
VALEIAPLFTGAIAAGALRIESASFVHPKLVPAMADAEAMMKRGPRPEGVSRIGLVLNRRGYDRAVSAGVDEVNVVVPASNGFAKANQAARIP